MVPASPARRSSATRPPGRRASRRASRRSRSTRSRASRTEMPAKGGHIDLPDDAVRGRRRVHGVAGPLARPGLAARDRAAGSRSPPTVPRPRRARGPRGPRSCARRAGCGGRRARTGRAAATPNRGVPCSRRPSPQAAASDFAGAAALSAPAPAAARAPRGRAPPPLRSTRRRAPGHERRVLEARHLDVQVDAVEQRARDARDGSAAPPGCVQRQRPFGSPAIAAGTGIHRRDQLEARRETPAARPRARC